MNFELNGVEKVKFDNAYELFLKGEYVRQEHQYLIKQGAEYKGLNEDNKVFGTEGKPTLEGFLVDINELFGMYNTVFPDETEVIINMANGMCNITLTLFNNEVLSVLRTWKYEQWAYDQYTNNKIHLFVKLKAKYEELKKDNEFAKVYAEPQRDKPYVSEFDKMYDAIYNYINK